MLGWSFLIVVQRTQQAVEGSILHHQEDHMLNFVHGHNYFLASKLCISVPMRFRSSLFLGRSDWEWREHYHLAVFSPGSADLTWPADRPLGTLGVLAPLAASPTGLPNPLLACPHNPTSPTSAK